MYVPKYIYSYIHIDRPQLQLYIHRRTLNFTVRWRPEAARQTT